MYDIVIIGCGPAGMTAAIYALRANKKVLILEKETIGGLITSSPLVENYPGFKQISGMDLGNNLSEQVLALGGVVELEEVIEIVDGDIKTVITDEHRYQTKSIIIATGSKPRLLGLPNEEDYIGNGLSFCVACDGPLYKEKDVAVIGGGNSAIVTALSLAELCNKVTIIQNLATLTAEQTLIDRLAKKNNLEVIYEAHVKALAGDEDLKSITIENAQRKITEIKVAGLFVSIGQEPQNDFLKNLITLDDYQYVLASDDCLTNKTGIFVAGDCRKKKVRQLTTAVSDGTIAALEAINYLNNKED
jgi:thioredoxin reductase (NADPH)